MSGFRLFIYMFAALLVSGLTGVVFHPADAGAQGRTRIAVTAFENKVKSQWWDPSWRIGEGLAEMLTTELSRTGRFVVIERIALDDVLKEQELSQSGLVASGTGPATGGLMGAQVVVRGAITEFDENTAGGGFGVQHRDFGLSAQGGAAHVALDLRLIDTTTGQVLGSHRAARSVPAGGGGFGAGLDGVQFGANAFYRTPIGQATRAAIQDAVQYIVAVTPQYASAPAQSAPAPQGQPQQSYPQSRPQGGAAYGGRTAPPEPRPAGLSFAVVKVQGQTVYINAGTNADVRVGEVFAIVTEGEALIDPDTGLRLGNSDEVLGAIRITRVFDRYAMGTILQGGQGQGVQGIKRGDRVIPQ